MRPVDCLRAVDIASLSAKTIPAAPSPVGVREHKNAHVLPSDLLSGLGVPPPPDSAGVSALEGRVEFLAGVFDFVAAIVGSRRGLFWFLMVFIATGLIAVAVNFLEPGRPAL